MLDLFKTFDARRMQLDDLVALEAFGHGLRESYDRQQIDEPEYVSIQLKAVRREIRSRVADKLESRKREVQRQLASLETPAERKKKLQAELTELDKATKE